MTAASQKQRSQSNRATLAFLLLAAPVRCAFVPHLDGVGTERPYDDVVSAIANPVSASRFLEGAHFLEHLQVDADDEVVDLQVLGAERCGACAHASFAEVEALRRERQRGYLRCLSS